MKNQLSRAHLHVPPEGEIYRLCGLTLASDYPFVTPLPAGRGRPQLTFRCLDWGPPRNEWAKARPRYRSSFLGDVDEGGVELYHGPGYDVLVFGRLAEFFLWRNYILCRPLALADEILIELRLLGPVLAYWLVRRGMLALHGAAVELNGTAVAFLAGRHGGKTALAAYLVQSGAGLVSDDLVVINLHRGMPVVRATYPQMRMWPDDARRILGDAVGLPRVHPTVDKRRVPVHENGLGRFRGGQVRLAAVYELQPVASGGAGDQVCVVTVAPSEAVTVLARYGFVAPLVSPAGEEARQLELAARVLERVPLRRLIYSTGLERLPAVAGAVVFDLLMRLAEAEQAATGGQAGDDDGAG